MNKVFTEDQEQTRLVVYLSRKGVPHFASANGGSRNLMEAVKLKRMGVSAGVPDICVPVARKGHHGLFIEMKRTKGGVVSSYQKEWLSLLQREGYLAVVAKGANEAILIVDDYFRDEPYVNTRPRDEIETEIPAFI